MTGPSRSMDIGYVSCVGVHGPGDVTVWVIADE
jgi:L-lactate utilization protein LutC